jgi:RTX calcium-binding nonapeptide repeat (4 copies)
VACLEVLVAGDACHEGEGAVVRQGQLIALVVAFLLGCAVVLTAGASGVHAEASKKEEARCQGTRTIKLASNLGVVYTTNDLPGCPKGGLLLGTDKRDKLDGKDGDDEIRGLGGSDGISDGPGDDVIYGGDGDDNFYGDEGHDVIYGGDGNDMLASNDDGGDKLYCGAGRDKYFANPTDYVDSSCETASAPPAQSGHAVIYSASASPSSGPQVLADGGGPSILLPAAALLLGSGILTYAIVRRR